jgi:hypothetical protein
LEHTQQLETHKSPWSAWDFSFLPPRPLDCSPMSGDSMRHVGLHPSPRAQIHYRPREHFSPIPRLASV